MQTVGTLTSELCVCCRVLLHSQESLGHKCWRPSKYNRSLCGWWLPWLPSALWLDGAVLSHWWPQ